MVLGRGAAVAVVLVALLNACSAQRLGLTWEIAVVTPRVPRGGDLVFRVETKDAVGTLVEGVDYVWFVDSTSVKGGRHRGSTPQKQHFRVDGVHGPGQIRIYTTNDEGLLIEMATAEFQVE